VVFVSSDRDEVAFNEYFSHMPFKYAVRFDSPNKGPLAMKFRVSGIPALMLLDNSTGELITDRARDSVLRDESASAFPWPPRGVWDILAEVDARHDGKAFADKDGNAVSLETLRSCEAVLLYFSAHWCPPCRGFTPVLADWYTKRCTGSGALAGKCEVVFMSGDRDEKSYKEYLGSMPWKALPFSERSANAELSELCGVEGIPSLVVVSGRDGALLTKAGREKIESNPDGFPWGPQPVSSLSDALDFINECPTAVLFTDMCTDADNVQAAESAFRAVAAEYFDSAKGKCSNDLRFAIAGDGDEAVEQVRGFLGPAHMKDKNGPGAVRVTLVHVTGRAKYIMPGDARDIADETKLRAFCKSFVAGSLEGTSIKA
jgi:nucleoredoxin